MNKYQKIGGILVFFLVSAIFVVDVTTSFAEPMPLKVGFITVGPISDFGWNYFHEQGRVYLQKALGGKVTTSMVEQIPENSDVERVLEKLIAQGNKLIFATAYGYLEPALHVAAKHPDVIIMHCGNRARPKGVKNVGTYFASQYGAAYVVGTVVGHVSKKNKIGYIGGHPVPQILEKLNAFALGVHSANPNAKVSAVWTNSWNDPTMEAEGTMSLIDQGCDIVVSGDIDSPVTVIRTADSHHVLTATYNGGDMYDQAPKSCLVSARFNWGPLYEKITREVLNKSWHASDNRYGLRDGYVKLGRFGTEVPPVVQKEALDTFNDIASGKLVVFKGPLKDREGKLRIPAGKALSAEDREHIDWVVPWIEGSIPKY